MRAFFREIAVRLYAFAPIANYEGVPLIANSLNSKNLSDYINSTFKIALIAAAMIAAGRIVFAGWLYMTTDVWTNKQRARTVLGDALLGLVLIIATALILGQINPNILNLNIVTPASQNPNANPALIEANFQGTGATPF